MYTNKGKNSVTYTIPANTCKYIIVYKSLSQYPKSGDALSCTNATELSNFNFDITKDSKEYPVVRVFKIDDISLSCTLTVQAGGDYGSSGSVVKLIDDIGALANLNVVSTSTTAGNITINPNTANYIWTYMSLSQYYYSSSNTVCAPISNLEMITGMSLNYPIESYSPPNTLCLFKVINTSIAAKFRINSTGDYGNKSIMYKLMS